MALLTYSHPAHTKPRNEAGKPAMCITFLGVGAGAYGRGTVLLNGTLKGVPEVVGTHPVL